MTEHTKEYETYIKSQEWQLKKAVRLDIDNYKCVMCGRPAETCKRTRLQCHHITYKRLGNENIYTDLVTLCGTCHKHLHNYLNRTKGA